MTAKKIHQSQHTTCDQLSIMTDGSIKPNVCQNLQFRSWLFDKSLTLTWRHRKVSHDVIERLCHAIIDENEAEEFEIHFLRKRFTIIASINQTCYFLYIVEKNRYKPLSINPSSSALCLLRSRSHNALVLVAKICRRCVSHNCIKTNK